MILKEKISLKIKWYCLLHILDFDCIKEFFVFFLLKKNSFYYVEENLWILSVKPVCAVGEIVGTLQLIYDNNLINVPVIKV